MKQLTCGCEYVDSLILWFCDLHKHPGPESHKDGKGVIIRDLEAQVEERDKDMAIALDDHNKCVEDLIQQRDRMRDMLNDIRSMAYSSSEDLAIRILRRIEDGIVEKPKKAGNPWAPNLDYPSKPVCSCGRLTADNPECPAHGTKKQAARKIVHCLLGRCYQDACACPCDDCSAIRNF